MAESLTLWSSLINSKHVPLQSPKFVSPPFHDIVNIVWSSASDFQILLLNKLDLFIRDFEVKTFSVYFPDYSSLKAPKELFIGGNEALRAVAFLRQKFLQQVPEKREVYTYEMSATDTVQFRGKCLPRYRAIIYTER